MFSRSPWLMFALALSLTGCFGGGGDEEDCEGSMSWTFDGVSYAGSPGRTCALSQGPTFITINTVDDDGGADWQITFSDFTGTGTHPIVEFGDWNITGHASDESWWATEGTFVVDTWADPSLIGSFDVTGENADESLTMAAQGSFDVVVTEYVE